MLSLGLVPLSLLTAEAGEQLEETRPASALIREHAEQGDVLKAVSVVFFVVVAAALIAAYEPIGRRFSFMGSLRTNRAVRITLLVVAAAAGAFFIYQSIITGHSGAASVWAGLTSTVLWFAELREIALRIGQRRRAASPRSVLPASRASGGPGTPMQ